VFVDGNYVGIVDDFDGALQRLDLEAGPIASKSARQGSRPSRST
jgi:hypothetical protein